MHFPAGIWALFVRFQTFFGRPRYRRRIRLVALYRMDRFSAPYVNSEAQNFDLSAANYLLRTIYIYIYRFVYTYYNVILHIRIYD